MFEYRITKYDQSQRNEGGLYIGPSAWTSYSDVGETFDGKVLTIEECFRVESEYISAATEIFKEIGLPYLRLTRLEGREWEEDDLSSRDGPLYDLAFKASDLTEDAKILPKDIPTLLQMIFRGFLYATLEWRDEFYIHIGWDFYMYVGTNKDTAVQSSELFIERDHPSPYQAYNLSNNILRIERHKIGEEAVDESFEIKLTADYLEKLKPIWGFSDEHPFLGFWKIHHNFKDQIEKIVGQEFDFDAYEYSIQTVGWDD